LSGLQPIRSLEPSVQPLHVLSLDIVIFSCFHLAPGYFLQCHFHGAFTAPPRRSHWIPATHVWIFVFLLHLHASNISVCCHSFICMHILFIQWKSSIKTTKRTQLKWSKFWVVLIVDIIIKAYIYFMTTLFELLCINNYIKTFKYTLSWLY
jgi:hypothetical protein